ncbi:MAG TPA: bifunctional transaldolase/phosoglucose isomerase [Chloroflexota bacterium]|nr:bifunctional transaldolase/phosoglucose isomerase [Chloroflexota bacterium]
MAENPLRRLAACGQSVWNDNIRRSWIESGELQRLIDNDGLSGVTSNPTIFDKAIGGSDDYDGDVKKYALAGDDPVTMFKKIAATDVGMAADVLRSIYDRSQGRDGFVSIEVSPAAAHDTKRTIEDAHYFWETIGRPNIMIKVPATPEGIPAIEQLLYEGINVNITLIFAVDVYEEVMEAYLTALERRAGEGKPIDRIASVASFFVSRVDTLVDKLLEEKIGESSGARRGDLEDLFGKAAIANARIAYDRFRRVFGSERFQALQRRGAGVQKPLWASTSTKNPKYPDTYYVTSLVGEDTVNTMPPQTITAVRDHGEIECGTVARGVDESYAVMDHLRTIGIDIQDVTDQLTAEGVKSFVDSQNELFTTIAEKSSLVLSDTVRREHAQLNGHQRQVDATFERMQSQDFLRRLWDKDPSLWKPAGSDQSEIVDRLGWLHVSDCMLEHVARFERLADDVRSAGFGHAVVLGMGGSSLAPYVFAESFGPQQGFPRLLVVDSTDPAAITAVERAIDPASTLFLVSSKSGTTTETLSHYRTFRALVEKSEGADSGKHFVAITDPGTPLEQLAREHQFRDVFLNPADIGGRYSALSFFGLVPAAVAGLDVGKLLARAMRMEQGCAASVPAAKNPGAWLGTIMADLAAAGRDKVTFFVSPELTMLGLWLEQLLAESTGKEGRGLVPVPDSPPGDPSDYADDRLFVHIRLKSSDDSELDRAVEVLERAGHPVVCIWLDDLYDLGAEFFRWEFATAVAGALLGINAFNQPNVQESKDNTRALLGEYTQRGVLPEPQPLGTVDGCALYANEPARTVIGGTTDAQEAIAAYLAATEPPEYLAVMAYIAPDRTHDDILQSVRLAIRSARRVATTVGYGPRFLHSTGQLHKGGPAEGVFLQITARAMADVAIPGEPYSYGTLISAQALGDFQALQNHGRPAIRLHLPDEKPETLERLRSLIQTALERQPSGAGRAP